MRFRKSVIVALAVAATVSIAPAATAVDSMHLRGNATNALADAMPTAVDLRDRMPAIANQGATNSCSALAGVYAIGSYWAGETLNPFPTYAQTLSRAVEKYNAPGLFTGGGAGTNMLEMLDTVDDFGAYLATGDITARGWNVLPTHTGVGEFERAEWLRTFHNPDVSGQGIDMAIRHYLINGAPILANINVGPQFQSGIFPDGVYQGEAERGFYHAVALVGYDERGVIVQNSWGTSWGTDGYTHIGWGALDEVLVEAVAPIGWVEYSPAPAAA